MDVGASNGSRCHRKIGGGLACRPSVGIVIYPYTETAIPNFQVHVVQCYGQPTMRRELGVLALVVGLAVLCNFIGEVSHIVYFKMSAFVSYSL